MPVLDPTPTDTRDVARGPRRGVARPVLDVGHDPVVDGQPGGLRQLGSRDDTDAGDAECVVVALVADPGGMFVEPCHAGSEANLDSHRGQTRSRPRVELVAEGSGPQSVAHLEDRRPQPERCEA